MGTIRTRSQKKRLFGHAGFEQQTGDRKLNGYSGADRADSEMHFCASRVYISVARGEDLHEAIAREDKRWREYAVEQVKKVNEAPKVKQGPMRGHSAISYRWVDEGAFKHYTHHLVHLVNVILSERAKPV